MSSNPRILFVSWDGPGLSYLESLFVPIFEKLGELGYKFDVLQFSWGEPGHRDRVAELCARAGIGYRPVDVCRAFGPVGPLASALLGGLEVRRAVRDFRSVLIMPRSVLPSLATLAAGRRYLPPILLDADGLEIDERAEFSGLSTRSAAYRIMRRVEAESVRRAAAVLVRTPAARSILVGRGGTHVFASKFYIVTNGRPRQVFQPFDGATRQRVRAELSVPQDAPLIVYAGSVGYRYNTMKITAFARAVQKRRPDVHLLVLSGLPDAAANELGKDLIELGARAIISRVEPNQVPRYLAAADVGTAFIRSSFSTAAIAPVKHGEYLLCGLPIVGTARIGDTTGMISRGLMFPDNRGMEAAADWFVDCVLQNRDDFRDRTRAFGEERFSLERSVKDYAEALERVLC